MLHFSHVHVLLVLSVSGLVCHVMASCTIEENLKFLPYKFFYVITDQTFANPDKYLCQLRIQLNSEYEFKDWFKNFLEIT